MNVDDSDRLAAVIVYAAERIAEALLRSGGAPIGAVREEVKHRIVMLLLGETVEPEQAPLADEPADPGPSLFDEEPPPPLAWMLQQREAGEPSAEFEAAVSQMRAAIDNSALFLPVYVYEALKEAAGRMANASQSRNE